MRSPRPSCLPALRFASLKPACYYLSWCYRQVGHHYSVPRPQECHPSTGRERGYHLPLPLRPSYQTALRFESPIQAHCCQPCCCYRVGRRNCSPSLQSSRPRTVRNYGLPRPRSTRLPCLRALRFVSPIPAHCYRSCCHCQADRSYSIPKTLAFRPSTTQGCDTTLSRPTRPSCRQARCFASPRPAPCCQSCYYYRVDRRNYRPTPLPSRLSTVPSYGCLLPPLRQPSYPPELRCWKPPPARCWGSGCCCQAAQRNYRPMPPPCHQNTAQGYGCLPPPLTRQSCPPALRFELPRPARCC